LLDRGGAGFFLWNGSSPYLVISGSVVSDQPERTF
jgi:hypothetical protein